MKVLLIGVTGNVGSRMFPALLAHEHQVVAYVRTPTKIPSEAKSRLDSIVVGSATDSAAIKAAILHHNCDAVVNSAGLARTTGLTSQGEFPAIFAAVVQAALEAGRERGGAPIRCWLMSGYGILDSPKNPYLLVDYVPIFPSHKKNYLLIKSHSTNALAWSLFCATDMHPKHEAPQFPPPANTSANNLVAKADAPPAWSEKYRRIPLIGNYLNIMAQAQSYFAVLENCVDFIAADLEKGLQSEWVGKRIKCQRNNDESCARCSARKLYCTTTPVERKRRKVAEKSSFLNSGEEVHSDSKKREAYFDEMEDRIKRMESTIITSRLHGTAEQVDEKEEENNYSDKIEIQAELSDHLSNLVIDADGSPNFIGWASGFSLFSPQGLRWISEKVDDKNEFAQVVRNMPRHEAWGHAEEDLFHPMPGSQHSPLPSKDVALQYVNCFFTTINNVFPIISQKVFKSYFERQYSMNPPVGTAWYALFNAVLCLGSIRKQAEQEKHIRNSRLIDYTSITHEIGVEYFRNASSCFHKLVFKEANLMAMQAMTLIMFITTSSPNPQPAYVMTSAAGNLAYTLGLHRSLKGFGLDPEEIEQRRNVFWVFYLMEKTISRNLGRPSVINDDDIAIELPPKKSASIESSSEAKVYDIFQDQIPLAIIGSRIYSELYSASSRTKSELDRIKLVLKLDDHLQRWRDTVPVEIRPEHPIKCSEQEYIPVMMMHFKYLDTVILLHRLSGHQESFKHREVTDMKKKDQRPRPNHRVYASQSLCLAAARRSIRLLDTCSNNILQNQHLMWMALYYPLSASLVLLANILSNPQDQHAASDLHLMNSITSFITHSVEPGTSFAATPTLNLFKELCSITKRLVARVSSESSQNVKKQPENDEPGQSIFYPSSTLSDRSLSSDLNTETTSSFAPHDSRPTSSETSIPAPGPSPPYVSKQTPRGQDTQNTSDAKYLQKFTDNNALEFAPFISPETNWFDYNPTIYDSLLSPTTFEWDTANMWMPDFEHDPLTSADLMGLSADASIEYG